eukprot:2290557-Alexandrium_andersonii.AAC.1
MGATEKLEVPNRIARVLGAPRFPRCTPSKALQCNAQFDTHLKLSKMGAAPPRPRLLDAPVHRPPATVGPV